MEAKTFSLLDIDSFAVMGGIGRALKYDCLLQAIYKGVWLCGAAIFRKFYSGRLP